MPDHSTHRKTEGDVKNMDSRKEEKIAKTAQVI